MARGQGGSDVQTLKVWYGEALHAADADAARRLAETIRNAPLECVDR